MHVVLRPVAKVQQRPKPSTATPRASTPSPAPPAELRRHKRAFLKLATKITFSRISDAATAQRMFVDYLKQQQQA